MVDVKLQTKLLWRLTTQNTSVEEKRQISDWIRREVPSVDPNQVWRVEVRVGKDGGLLALFWRYAVNEDGKKFLDPATLDAACLPVYSQAVSCGPFDQVGVDAC